MVLRWQLAFKDGTGVVDGLLTMVQMRERTYYVYLLTNWDNKVMYVGMTNDLERRIFEHKEKTVKGFTEKYNVSKLVYYEQTDDVTAAISREKEIKKCRRDLFLPVTTFTRFLPAVEVSEDSE